jgi:hypothetical protein
VTARRWLLLPVLIAACGGRANSERLVPAHAGEGGSASGSERVTEEGGVAGGRAIATAGAAGGARDDATSSLIASGTRYCEDARYCFGLSCYTPMPRLRAVCVEGCEADADCGAGAVCLRSPELEAGCYRLCETPFDCEFGFDCFDFADVGEQLVCFPTPWAALWERRD